MGCDHGGGRADRRHRSVAGSALRPEHACAAAPLDAPGTSPARSHGSTVTRAAATCRFGARSPTTPGSSPRTSCSASARTTSSCCVRARTPARATRSRSPLLRRIRCTRSPRNSRAQRSATARVLTFACRPNNPTGALDPLPDARPLVVDEAYFEYSGETVVDLTAREEVIVLRTFSKLFGLAGERIGYAIARRDIADELNARQAPAPVTRRCGARDRCARLAPGPATGDRGARTARVRVPRAGARAARLTHELPLRPGRRRSRLSTRSTPRRRRAAGPLAAGRARPWDCSADMRM